MKLKLFILLVLFLTFILTGEETGTLSPAINSTALCSEGAAELSPATNPAPEAATIKDGYALLNSLLTLFENLPVVKEKKGEESETKQVNPGIVEVDSRLIQLSKDAKTAMESGVIDKIFHKRYQRMLTIFKMIITPIIRGELLKDLFMNAFETFVWDVTCEHWSWDDKDSIAKMAAAMEEEFVQMQFYLDSRQAREVFKKKIGKRILPPPLPPSAKKKPEAK